MLHGLFLFRRLFFFCAILYHKDGYWSTGIYLQKNRMMLDTAIICIITIILVILCGYVTKTNIGLWAIAAAYLLGAFVLEIKPSDIVEMWPIKVFLMLFSVTFFYGYAVLNGSLEKLSLFFIHSRIRWLLDNSTTSLMKGKFHKTHKMVNRIQYFLPLPRWMI